mmetsp:Transcript_30169/g.48455  ORF Transcript_30169/g.48455 Transcript_30169/m.48455 type:complete len:107 (-) Transcript_30169:1240-1560(-)
MQQNIVTGFLTWREITSQPDLPWSLAKDTGADLRAHPSGRAPTQQSRLVATVHVYSNAPSMCFMNMPPPGAQATQAGQKHHHHHRADLTNSVQITCTLAIPHSAVQ